MSCKGLKIFQNNFLTYTVSETLPLAMIFLVALVKSQTTIGSPSTGSSPKQTLSFPTSPDAYSFGKVDNLPIDYFKGQANIDIPVYTIQIDNVNIPVSLKYNTGGIKQNEIASSVGLGWSLSVPNRIMKSIEGMDDESSNLYFKDFQQADNYFSTSLHDLSDPASDLFYNNLADGKPDLYNYSLPTTSGSFIVNNNKGYTIPHEDIKITKGSSSIVIVDNEGNTFTLSPKNSVTSRRQGSMIEMSSNLYLLDNNVNAFSGSGKDPGWKGVSIGLSVGVGAGANVGSGNVTLSKTWLLNDVKPTAQRSLIDRATNAVSPVASAIATGTIDKIQQYNKKKN